MNSETSLVGNWACVPDPNKAQATFATDHHGVAQLQDSTSKNQETSYNRDVSVRETGDFDPDREAKRLGLAFFHNIPRSAKVPGGITWRPRR